MAAVAAESEDIEDLHKVLPEPTEPTEPTDPDVPPPPLEHDVKYSEPITDELLEYVTELLTPTPPTSQKEYETRIKKLNKKFRMAPRKSTLIKVAKQLKLPISRYIVKKLQKSTSGVAVISVMTSAADFSCKFDCHMCPKYPDYPRSYVPGEPTSQRATRLGFDTALQLLDRCRALHENGHPIDKLEIIILGGTWSSYPDEYQERFVRDVYYAANIFHDWNEMNDTSDTSDTHTTVKIPLRRRLPLEDEIYINQTESRVHIIGMTPETRPDCISKREILKFRRFGFTRVQLGIQHTDDVVLKTINRMCTSKHNKRGIRLLKEAGFKVDIHLMFNLPTTTPDSDLEMAQIIIRDPDYQADHWKLYPTSVTPYTTIQEWFEAETYKPYTDFELIRILLKILPQIPIYIRVNRIFRDIPSTEIVGAVDLPNLRQILDQECQRLNIRQRDIRAREVKDRPFDPATDRPRLYNTTYPASNGQEMFISYENHDQTILYGFIRLRFNSPDTTRTHHIPALRDAALIRELHVYGSLIRVTGDATDTSTQHRGIGSMLMREAERLAIENGFNKMAIIAGIGVRGYYEAKHHYRLEDTYMVKDLAPPAPLVPELQVPELPVPGLHPEPEPVLPTLDDIEWKILRDLMFTILVICFLYNLMIVPTYNIKSNM